METLLKTVVEESRDQIMGHISGASNKNKEGIDESLNRFAQEAYESRNVFSQEMKTIQEQLELFQKHLDEKQQERVNAKNEELRVQIDTLRGELRGARSVSVMTQTLDPLNEVMNDQSISQAPRPFHLWDDLGNLPDARLPPPHVLLFRRRLIYEKERIQVILNFARLLGHVPSSAFTKHISHLKEDLDLSLNRSRRHMSEDAIYKSPRPSRNWRSHSQKEVDYYRRKLQSVNDELRKEHQSYRALRSDLLKVREENDRLSRQNRTLKRRLISMRVRWPNDPVAPISPFNVQG